MKTMIGLEETIKKIVFSFKLELIITKFGFSFETSQSDSSNVNVQYK